MEIEQVKKAETPEEMRAEIFRLSRYHHMVRNVLDRANYQGLSAEDKYTIIAYYALADLAKFQSIHLDSLRLDAIPPMILTTKKQ